MICVWNDSPAPGIKQGAYITIEGSRSKLDYYKNNRMVNRFPFPTFAKTFTSPLVRYDNLIHTGHGEWDDQFDDETSAVFGKVLSSKKAVGSSWGIPTLFVREYINELGLRGNGDFGYGVKRIPNVHDEYRRQLYILYVFKNTTVSDAFPNLSSLIYDYRSAGIALTASALKGSSKIGDIVTNGLEDNHPALIGLLYGYPIESTISLLIN
jgi:hypothetical protein